MTIEPHSPPAKRPSLKRSWTIWVAVAVLAVFGVRWVLRKMEPSYQGKSISEWYGDINIEPGDFSPRDSEPGVLAIKAMGKDAVPYLIGQIRGLNSPLHMKVVNWVNRRWKFEPNGDRPYDQDRFYQPLECLAVLGTNAADAVPDVIELATGVDRDRSRYALNVLGAIHSRPELTIPFLLGIAVGTNQDSRTPAIWALEGFGSEAKSVLPVFISHLPLEGTNSSPGRAMVDFLGRLGADAKPAVPMLISEWQANNDPRYRHLIAWTLQKIDPDAAAKAGIKFIDPDPARNRRDVPSRRP